MVLERQHVNVIDAAAAGASDGLTLALNVAAMLIAFLAFIALFDFLLGVVRPGLTLASVFAVVFSPVAVLMGVPRADVPADRRPVGHEARRERVRLFREADDGVPRDAEPARRTSWPPTP